MVHNKKNKRQQCINILIILLLILHIHLQADLSSLAKNDPYPVFSTLNIDDLFLLTAEQLKYKDSDWAKRKKNRVNFSISPFTQNADRGKTIRDQPCPAPFIDLTLTKVPCPDSNVALGDLTGRSGMLALLYGKLPASANGTYPNGPNSFLSIAFSQLFPDSDPGTITNAQFIDPQQLFGYFSFPLKYRKRGVRFELDVRIWDDIGFRIQTGASAIRQTVENKINFTNTAPNPPTDPNVNVENVNDLLMDQVDNIADQIGLFIGDTNHASIEEVRINLFWRHAFNVNEDTEYDWTHFLCIPYIEVTGSFSPGDARDPNELFAATFGNNKHSAVGFTTGINFDFIETIEIGGEVSFTHFFKRDFCN